MLKQSDGNRANTPFRLDINGLRAWAVLAVILYHFGVPGFAGGFIGVDVFFVISGYLMTGIVLRGLERGSFSLVDFYMARGRRIIPALAAMCCVLMVLGRFSGRCSAGTAPRPGWPGEAPGPETTKPHGWGFEHA